MIPPLMGHWTRQRDAFERRMEAQQARALAEQAVSREQAGLARLYGDRLAGFDPLGRVILWGESRIPKIRKHQPKPKGETHG